MTDIELTDDDKESVEFDLLMYGNSYLCVKNKYGVRIIPKIVSGDLG